MPREHWTEQQKREAYEQQFSLSYDDLIEAPMQYRDASIRYINTSNQVQYKFSWISNTWSVA
jgi:hypothetical protein